ncbi:ABC transporter [Biscogniauxia sp. FL1348]|nr:ABC transporter [Biscogniauxia sp. FL1348]
MTSSPLPLPLEAADPESAATSILCTAKQTRFNIIGTPNYRELDIEGLNITVSSSSSSFPGPSTRSKGKSKATRKGNNASTEILSNATLRLQAGARYAIVGRNGTGKSTLLRAIAEKLIPGVPEAARIVILQQTDVAATTSTTPTTSDETHPAALLPGEYNDKDRRAAAAGGGSATVLESVVETATARQQVQQEIDDLSRGIESSEPLGALRAYRKVQYERLQKELFLRDKDARLRSGARGMQARKALLAMERQVVESRSRCQQSGADISPETLAQETSEAADMLAELQIQADPGKLARVESRARKILAGLGFSEASIQKPVASLSGGWKMRTSLAAALLQETDILILDEPTNYLDLLGIMWLQQHLLALAESTEPPTLILVSHDREFISLCSDLLIIRDKDLAYFHGDLPTYEASRAEKKAHLIKMKAAQEKQKEHIQQTIQRNMREGKAKDDQNKIRQAKSRQKKLEDRWGLEVSARGGRFKLNRDLVGFHLTSREEIDVPQDERPVHFVLPEPLDLRFPGALLSLEKVLFRYPREPGAKTNPPVVLQDVNLSISMGDRIGVVGLNGSGKSTLVRLLTEGSRPTSGNVTMHPRLKLGYYSQHAVEALHQTGMAEPDLTSLSILLRDTSGEVDEGQIRAQLASLGLPGRLASDVPIRKLSGGQLVRLAMARILWQRPHCLVLDEVTTHLDYETVIAMREALQDWEGAVVLVSHDRWFMHGVIEGLVDDEVENNESDLGDETPRRRAVYRLRAGRLVLLEGGTQEFENSLEKKMRKIGASD